jgi:hypothetical protein
MKALGKIKARALAATNRQRDVDVMFSRLYPSDSDIKWEELFGIAFTDLAEDFATQQGICAFGPH